MRRASNAASKTIDMKFAAIGRAGDGDARPDFENGTQPSGKCASPRAAVGRFETDGAWRRRDGRGCGARVEIFRPSPAPTPNPKIGR
jgi:hypothetical protein